MAKICNQEECNNPVFSNGFCQYHQSFRTDKKWLKSLLKQHKKGVAKIKSRSDKPKKESKSFFPFKNQVEVFNYLWEMEEHTCWLTGISIHSQKNGNKWVNCFAHVLPKGAYTYWKLNPDNIRLLHPEIHELVDNYKEEYEEKYPNVDFRKWFDLQDKMKEEYEQFKKKHLLS